jgi:hypothetical protein
MQKTKEICDTVYRILFDYLCKAILKLVLVELILHI